MSNTLDDRTTTVTPEEAAQRIGIKVGTIQNWRWSGRGPKFIKCGGRVRYRLSDLAEWLDAQTRSSTSDRGSDA